MNPMIEQQIKPQPAPGQIWEDLDARATYQEFTILAVVSKGEVASMKVDPSSKWAAKVARALGSGGTRRKPYVLARRGPRVTRIRIDRLLAPIPAKGDRGYRYIGMSR